MVRDRGGVAAPLQQLARSLLRYLPALTLLVFLGPVVAGLLGTLLPAFGYLPALGGEQLSLAPWRELAAAPGIGAAVRLTLTSGLLSTLLALALTIFVFAAGHGTAGPDAGQAGDDAPARGAASRRRGRPRLPDRALGLARAR